MSSHDTEKKSFGQKVSTGCSGFLDFLHHKDEETGVVTYMGRTGKSWAKIGVFYLIFYGFLAGFFSAMLAVFLSTVNKPEEGGPKLTQFLDNQPGLNRIDREKKYLLSDEYDSTDTKNTSAMYKYMTFVEDYLKGYAAGDNSGTLCDPVNIKGIPKGEARCIFDRKELGPCNDNTTFFGLSERKPCVYVKINKIYDWVPDSDGGHYLKLKCQGATTYPEGFMLAAFPFRGQKSYLAPIVAVQVDTNGTAGVTKEIVCELEGKHIKTSKTSVNYRAYGKVELKVGSV